jgi:hypothetical protein
MSPQGGAPSPRRGALYLWENDMWRCWNYDGVHINLNDMNVEA